MSQRLPQPQLEAYLWEATTFLRGTMDAGDYKQVLFPLLFYKRLCDVFDEETQSAAKASGGEATFSAFAQNRRFQIPPAAHWRHVRQATQKVGATIQSALSAIETANPESLSGIFGDAHWANPDRFPDAKLGELLKKTEERESAPLRAGLRRYLLVEHLDAGSLRIRRWGEIAKGKLPPTFYKVFRRGQVLYPTRNPQLRRAAVADFDGICGEKTLTLSVREGADPRFLPFVFQSEAFLSFVTHRQIGSTNPHVRWRDVADFEFDLPPLDQQRRLADLLTAVEASIQAHQELGQQLEALRTSVCEAALHGATESGRKPGAAAFHWPIKCVAEVCERVAVGIAVTPARYYRPTGVRCFRSANVRRGFVEDTDWVFITEEAHRKHAKSTLRQGDVLVVRSGVCVGMACVVPPGYAGANCIDIVLASPRRDVVEPEWLAAFLNSRAGQVEIQRRARGLAQKHFGVNALKQLPLPVPPLAEQQRHLTEWQEIAAAIAENQKHLASLGSLMSALVATVFAVPPTHPPPSGGCPLRATKAP